MESADNPQISIIPRCEFYLYCMRKERDNVHKKFSLRGRKS
jgi:hypothetical protein